MKYRYIYFTISSSNLFSWPRNDLVQARLLGQTLCWALMHQPHLDKIWEYQNGFLWFCFPNCLIFQLSLLGMAYVLFNRRAHLQRLPVLCTIVCRRRQTNQTVNVTRENIAFFQGNDFNLVGFKWIIFQTYRVHWN